MKKIIALLLALALLFACAGCGQTSSAGTGKPASDSREFTDDCGRTVTVPNEISKVAVSGPLAQIYCIPLCLDIFVGFSSDYTTQLEKYLGSEYKALPMLGHLYGGKGTMDLEALLSAGPDVVIDVGDQKGSIVEDLNALTEQSGIPFVHIDGSLEGAPETYRRLGELLGRQEKAEQLALWCEDVLRDIDGIMTKVDAKGGRANVVYCLGEKGLNVLANGSIHAKVLDKLTNNIAVLPDVVSSGNGNEIDFEQLMLWNPEVLVFAPESAYSAVKSDETWQMLDAVKSGKVCEAPSEPYGWMQTPPAVQQYLGMLWLTSLLYPEDCDYDLQEKVTEYYNLFYGYELSEVDYEKLTENACIAN